MLTLAFTVGALPSEETEYQYDAVGNECFAIDPLNHSTESRYDGLNRLRTLVDPVSNTITLDYDGRDNLVAVSDPRNLATTYQYNGFDELELLTSPDTGITDYDYDGAGNLILKTDARHAVADYDYDVLNRVDLITYSDETLDFSYDQGVNATGLLSGVSDGSGSTAYTYDLYGRVDTKTQQAVDPGNSTTTLPALVVDYDYNAQGQMVALTLPSGVQVGYQYRADGRIRAITLDSQIVVQDIDYFPFGEPKSWTFANGARYQRRFDLDGRVDQYSAAGDTRTLGFDDASRVTGLSDNEGVHSWTFGYDALDRLTLADNVTSTGPLASLTLGWDYDATGNREYETRNGVTTDYVTEPLSNQLVEVGGVSRSYDANGNLVTDGALTFDYSQRNRLTEVQQLNSPLAQYRYNGFGERVVKAVGGQLTQFVYDEAGHLLGEYDATGQLMAEHVWLNDTPIVTLRPAGQGHGGQVVGSTEVFYLWPDHLDTPRVITNAADTAIWRWDSGPFGDDAANDDADGDGVAFAHQLRFPGQYFDAETGLHYNYFRDYQPALDGMCSPILLG